MRTEGGLRRCQNASLERERHFLIKSIGVCKTFCFPRSFILVCGGVRVDCVFGAFSR